LQNTVSFIGLFFQLRPVILRSLLIVATPYPCRRSLVRLLHSRERVSQDWSLRLESYESERVSQDSFDSLTSPSFEGVEGVFRNAFTLVRLQSQTPVSQEIRESVLSRDNASKRDSDCVSQESCRLLAKDPRKVPQKRGTPLAGVVWDSFALATLLCSRTHTLAI